MDEYPVPQQIRSVVVGGIEQAQQRRSSTVAPEHLLLSLAAQTDSLAAGILADAGLTYDALVAGLDEERSRSLGVVGIHDLDPALLGATVRLTRPVWGSTTREAFRRAQAAGRGRRHRVSELDVLYGIVTANVGTVARVLEYAGIDRDALIGRVERERLAGLEDGQQRSVHQAPSAQERQAQRREAAGTERRERRDAANGAQAGRPERRGDAGM
ncbi:Clp protease N-terminal domain-containing protein [Rathayibacter sp. KR2-224]|uniref:Clp protease N-terminal domain-containing protein n=1 Tax=Rathayibacter sp. KR2-224 TaxID=3400913 RepID=UPI003C07998E